MLIFSLQFFCISMVLAIIKTKFAAAHQYTREVLFNRKVVYDWKIADDDIFFIKNVTSFNRIQCCKSCRSSDRPSCVGVLYNREQIECKLLKHYLTGEGILGNISHEQWEYWRIIKASNEVADCKRTIPGWEYRGTINVTKSGIICQHWASQSPHRHDIGLTEQENYCRYPEPESTPWCYTTDPDRRFESCDIPMCDSGEVADCKRSYHGWNYNGKINVTKSGRTCQAWASQYPHPHSVGTYLPENYCRNPDPHPTPWCYTTDPNKRLELCDIPICVIPPLECLTEQDPTGRSYFGKQNVADTGDLCQRWDSQYPHGHRFRYLADQDNYCRNPDGGGAPWCYTVNLYKRWSECIIPRC